jgi:hypothetical protein
MQKFKPKCIIPSLRIFATKAPAIDDKRLVFVFWLGKVGTGGVST